MYAKVRVFFGVHLGLSYPRITPLEWGVLLAVSEVMLNTRWPTGSHRANHSQACTVDTENPA